MANDKVFASGIRRTLNKLNNNLYDLLVVDPVTPLPINNKTPSSCDFVPKTDKYFIPKRKLRLKVKTVKDIRNLLESDISTTLSIDIEKQENVLLRKIRSGSSKDEKTKLLAKNILKSDKPISRMAWQMVININPDNYAHSSQFVLWNGKYIQVNGSRGGKSKFIYKYDLGERRASLLQRYECKKNSLIAKKDLLKQSLHVKFKPGPLSRKKYLDISYQKYNVGSIELAHLPKPGLDILPEYGKPIETSVANFLHNLRDVNGIISDKWAQFAVSALGKYDNGRAVQLKDDYCVTFDLCYKYDQRQLLMRYDMDNLDKGRIEKEDYSNIYLENEDKIFQEVKTILSEMILSVEINVMQNTMYSGDDTPRNPDTLDINNGIDSHLKNKIKRRGQSELHRLDVTVIRLFDTQEKKEMGSCPKSYCRLGCICDSLCSSYHFKNHCGRFDCMLECKCDFNKYHLDNYIKDSIIPNLVSLDREKISKLSKEEQKFHHTVILSGEKSILLKSQRRNWKAPEKYADFYSNMCLKTKKDIKRILSVVEIKLNCENIEPWCMIHNLYKCYCKGQFTEKMSITTPNEDVKTEENKCDNTKLPSPEAVELGDISKTNESHNKTILTPRTDCVHNTEDNTSTQIFTDEKDISLKNYRPRGCARVKAYKKRKYSDTFYANTNKKIMEMEENDHGLRNRMLEILKIEENDAKKPKKDSGKISVIDLSTSPVPTQTDYELDKINNKTEPELPNSPLNKFSSDIISTPFTSPTEHKLNKKLKAWLEPSLKMYRQRFGNGFFKQCLDPPKAGKISLYPWDFIINRFHEKKNLFLVSNQKPFRIFMAVDYRNSLFDSCINIRSIDDLDKYPISIKNIVTNEVDRLKDQLCILRGLNVCWELVGSVKKVCDNKSFDDENNPNESSSDGETRSPQCSTKSPALVVNDSPQPIAVENCIEQSKWFIMTLEGDFTEIQFFLKGFFVKYDSIIRAINVARVSKKTVRLSSQKCNEDNSDTQFGIYAIPNTRKYCVFIGPYEKNEPLGIEIVKSTLYNRSKKTKGIWVTTNKVDNSEVIDNPLSFMSHINMENGQILDDTLQDESKLNSIPVVENKNAGSAEEKTKIIRMVKPITIPKTNNFYHLTSSGLLKPISISPEKNISKTSFILKKRLSLDLDAAAISGPLICKKVISQLNESPKSLCTEEKQKLSTKRPIAEIAPQVKVVEECKDSKNIKQKISNKKNDGGMFVLKPEEINSRSLINKIRFTQTPTVNNSNIVTTTAGDEIDMDIESFLANSIECSPPTNDIYVISDDEDYCNIDTSNNSNWKDVWIICKKLLSMGWISGRQYPNKHLSFEFPGFKFTEFYPEEEAFAKITQVLARKIYVPEHVKLTWSVVDKMEDLEKLNVHKLKQENLNSDFVLTNKGLIHKLYLVGRTSKRNKQYGPEKKCITTSLHRVKGKDVEFAKNVTEKLDIDSNLLLEKGEMLLNDTMLKRGELANRFGTMSNDQRQKISDRLRSIISNLNSS